MGAFGRGPPNLANSRVKKKIIQKEKFTNDVTRGAAKNNWTGSLKKKKLGENPLDRHGQKKKYQAHGKKKKLGLNFNLAKKTKKDLEKKQGILAKFLFKLSSENFPSRF